MHNEKKKQNKTKQNKKTKNKKKKKKTKKQNKQKKKKVSKALVGLEKWIFGILIDWLGWEAKALQVG